MGVVRQKYPENSPFGAIFAQKLDILGLFGLKYHENQGFWVKNRDFQDFHEKWVLHTNTTKNWKYFSKISIKIALEGYFYHILTKFNRKWPIFSQK